MQTQTKKMRNVYTILVVIMMTFLGFNKANAQKTYYEGSAYVHIKDKDGNKRVATAITYYRSTTETAAKADLDRILNINKDTHSEEFDSRIFYNIHTTLDGDKKKYGGSASVKVQDKNGKIRTLNATTNCSEISKRNAMDALKKSLERQKNTHSEQFITQIYFDIDSCN